MTIESGRNNYIEVCYLIQNCMTLMALQIKTVLISNGKNNLLIFFIILMIESILIINLLTWSIVYLFCINCNQNYYVACSCNYSFLMYIPLLYWYEFVMLKCILFFIHYVTDIKKQWKLISLDGKWNNSIQFFNMRKCQSSYTACVSSIFLHKFVNTYHWHQVSMTTW